jgi:hypothetical protein
VRLLGSKVGKITAELRFSLKANVVPRAADAGECALLSGKCILSEP